jgi:putative sterol carrier protein
MSHAFLSDQWIEAARDIRHRYAGDVPRIDAVVRINVVTTKVPFGDGTVKAYIDTSSGTLDMELGELDAADLTVTTDYETARKIFVEQDQQAAMQAFMGGKIKVVGDIMKVMGMQTAIPQTDITLIVAAEIKSITA